MDFFTNFKKTFGLGQEPSVVDFQKVVDLSNKNQALKQQQIPQPQSNDPLASIYNANPQDPRVRGIDPARFGYAEDAGQYNPQPMQPMKVSLNDILKRRF